MNTETEGNYEQYRSTRIGSHEQRREAYRVKYQQYDIAAGDMNIKVRIPAHDYSGIKIQSALTPAAQTVLNLIRRNRKPTTYDLAFLIMTTWEHADVMFGRSEVKCVEEIRGYIVNFIKLGIFEHVKEQR